MHTRGGDADTTRSGVAVTPRVCIIFLIQRTEVNYSAYTTVATPQDIDQVIYFKAFVQFFGFPVTHISLLVIYSLYNRVCDK